MPDLPRLQVVAARQPWYGSLMIDRLFSLAWATALPLALAVALPAGAGASVPPPPAFTVELGKDHPLAGRIFLPPENRMATVDEVVQAMRAADFVLLGEKHDNPDHHALQAWAVQNLVAGGRRPAVAFEMFGTDQGRRIAGYLARRPKDAAGLGKATSWEKTGWPDWTYYSPIAQAALDAGLPVVAANLPEEEARAITRRHPVSQERLAELGLDQPLPRALYADLAEDIRASHCNMLPETAVSPMVMAQRAKDGSMAAVMARAAKARGMDSAVLITGSGHARKDRGVPLALTRLVPEGRVFSIAFIEVVPGENDPGAYAVSYGKTGFPFDAVWFTPRLPGTDPCVGFAEHMRQRGDKNKN